MQTEFRSQELQELQNGLADRLWADSPAATRLFSSELSDIRS